MGTHSDTKKTFTIYVTHVDADGPFIKISGQIQKQGSLLIESHIHASLANLDKGVGAVPSMALLEGVVCAAKYKDGSYYRAKIVNTSNVLSGLVGVHFIDYGNRDVVSVSTIRYLENYPPVLTQLPGQAADYMLAKIIQPSGRWEEPIVMKLQSMLCYTDFPSTVEVQTNSYTIISLQFSGADLSQYLVMNGYGITVPLQKQETLLQQLMQDNPPQSLSWPTVFPNEPNMFSEHVPFLNNQSFPSNPAAAMRMPILPTGVALKGGFIQSSLAPQIAPSAISQRLLVNKVARTPVHLKPARQVQQASQAASTPVAAQDAPRSNQSPTKGLPVSPKKTSTYRSRLLEIGSQHKVFVSFAEEGPELFAVQLLSEEKKLREMMNKINCQPHRSLSEPPMIGSVCLGRMPSDGTICRAIVMNVSGSQCTLYYVDFGDTEMVSYYDIFDIPEEFVKPGVFAMRFCLSGVKKLKKGQALNVSFKTLVSGKMLTLKVVAPEGPPLIQYGELFLGDGNVLEILCSESRTLNLEFKGLELLPMGCKRSVLLSYVDSCIKFYVQLSDNIEELDEVMEAVRVHCESTAPAKELSVGSACCARFPDDGNWYRARILENKNKRVLVAYVDYGNEQEVELSDLRTIAPNLIQLPAQAMKCALKGFEDKPVETKTSNQLEMLALEKTLWAHVVSMMAEDTMLVSLVDESVSPPLDVARRMAQLSQPRSSHENKASTPVRKEAPDMIFSSPEGSVKSDDNKRRTGGGFRSDKAFKDDRRQHRDSNEEWSSRGGSFRGRNDRENKGGFERSGPGRHSEKYADNRENDRRGGGKPWENNQDNATSAPSDEWEEPKAQPSGSRPNRDSDYNKQGEHGENNNDRWRDKKDSYGERKNNWQDKRDNIQDKKDNWGDKKDNWQDKKDSWGDKKDNWKDKREYKDQRSERGDRGERSNFTPRERVERSFDNDSRPERNYGSNSNDPSRERGSHVPPYKSRSKFTQVTYQELPDPVPLETLFTEPEVELGAQHEVSLTWFINPDSFYTQIISLQPKFLDMMQKIPEIYKGVKPFTGTVNIGASILARYPEDGVLYRATIIAVQPFGKFIVQYVDFGNKFVIDAKDVWQLDRQLLELPKMAVHCSLVGVTPPDGEWKTNKDVDLCFNAPRYQSIFQECVEEKFKVSLWNNGASVADLLVEKQFATPTGNSSEVTLKDEPIDLSIIVGQQLQCRVTHVHSHASFYVQLDLQKAELVEKAITDYDTSLLSPLPSESVAEGVHCTVRHEGRVYRAILRDVSQPAALQATLPDLGSTISTTAQNLSILPTELSLYYYQSLQCCFNNYTEESTKLLSVDELKQKLTGNKFIAYINDVDGICLVTTLYECATGQKVAVFEPDEGAYDEVAPLCMRAVFNYNFGLGFLTHAENLNEIYLQKCMDEDRVAELLNALFEFYEEGSPNTLETYTVETNCAAKSSDGNWYRATILSASETDCKVQFVDYGNSETIALDLIKKLDPKFYEPCSLALVISLGLIALQDDAAAKLMAWTSEKELQVTLAIGNDGWLANLHLDGEDLSVKLVKENIATAQAPTEENVNDIHVTEEPVSLPPGSTQVYVSHIDTPGQFWLQMSDKVDKIEEIQSQLQEESVSYNDVDNRELGTICVAKYSADDMWYRAEVLDSDADITTVRFIDYGNTDVLDNVPGLLKVIPEDLKAIDRHALKSSVNAVPTGTGQWSEPASDFFTELLGDTSTPVDALIVLKDVTTYVDLFVNGQNITDRLVAEGHAIRSEETECGDLASCFASHVNSPSEFWIQLENATPDLQAVENAMVDAENFPELTEKEEGVICAAKYPEDESWYRAQIIVDGSEGTEVLFMDYGNASMATELRSLPDELKSKPALSRKCALQKPRDIKSWSRKSEIRFNDLSAEGATIFSVQFIASGDISIVELFHEGQSVTEELISLCQEFPQTERPTPVGQDLHSTGVVCHINTLDDFFVQLDESKIQLEEIEVTLKDAISFEVPLELKVGSQCVAYSTEDETWYRSKILEFCDIGSHIQFIDYGNKAKCEEFRKLPEALEAIEPLAKSCKLVGWETNEENLLRKLEGLLNDCTPFQIEYLDSTKEPALVKILIDGEDITKSLKTLPASNTISEDLGDKEGTPSEVEYLDSSKEPELAKINGEDIQSSKKLPAKDFSDNETAFLNTEKEPSPSSPGVTSVILNEEQTEVGNNDQINVLNLSKLDLDESVDSNHTVIENKSFNEHDLSFEKEDLVNSPEDKQKTDLSSDLGVQCSELPQEEPLSIKEPLTTNEGTELPNNDQTQFLNTESPDEAIEIALNTEAKSSPDQLMNSTQISENNMPVNEKEQDFANEETTTLKSITPDNDRVPSETAKIKEDFHDAEKLEENKAAEEEFQDCEKIESHSSEGNSLSGNKSEEPHEKQSEGELSETKYINKVEKKENILESEVKAE